MTCTAELSSRKTSRRVSCRAPRLTMGISSYKKRHGSFRFGSSTIAWISKQNTQPSSDVFLIVKSRRAWGGLQNSPSFLKRLDLRWFLNVTWWVGGFPKKDWNYWFAFRLSPNILPSTTRVGPVNSFPALPVQTILKAHPLLSETATWSHPNNLWHFNTTPIGSMYGIFTHIWLICMVNLSK